jgi:hypothetical protein
MATSTSLKWFVILVSNVILTLVIQAAPLASHYYAFGKPTYLVQFIHIHQLMNGQGDNKLFDITTPHSGSTWQSQADADNICRATFGDSWRLAEFHDGYQWGFAAYSNMPLIYERLWVGINDQSASCWN